MLCRVEWRKRELAAGLTALQPAGPPCRFGKRALETPPPSHAGNLGNLGSTASVKWWGPIRTPPRHGAHRKLRYGSSTELVSPSIANLWRPKFCHPEHRPLPPASLRRNTCLRPEHPSSPLVGPRSNLSCWPSPPRSHLHRVSAACDLRPDDDSTTRRRSDAAQPPPRKPPPSIRRCPPAA